MYSNKDSNTPPTPTAPVSPFALPMPLLDDGTIEYYFIIKRRSFFCYKFFLKIEISESMYIINFNSSVLKIPKSKTKIDIISILLTVGVTNKHIFKLYVMSDDKKLSTKILYNLEGIMNHINKTEAIMENVKYL
jgi:hypothetical protein